MPDIKALLPGLLCPAVAVPVQAQDPLIARTSDQAREFVKKHPVMKGKITETDLVDLWQQVQQLDRMVWLKTQRALPAELVPELRRRLAVNEAHMGPRLIGV